MNCFTRTLRYFSTGFSAAAGHPLRVCVVGSGPAGFYTAHQLIKRHADTKVDIFERLPIPFGLVRFGVAPDHPEVKNCINQFTSLAETEKCRFIGNVTVGKDVSLSQLRPYYHAVVMSYGADEDRQLGIPGEDLHGVHSARSFVGWYNGLPEHRDLNPDLSGEVAVIIGHGNVALDVARILLTPSQLLEHTDICDHALRALRESCIQRVHLIGRRGPLQVAFTIKELREMMRLPDCKFHTDHTQFTRNIRTSLSDLPRPRKRLTELMLKTADAEAEGRKRSEEDKECNLTFLRSPVELMTDQANHRVASVRMEINKLEGDRAVGSGEYEDLGCNLVLRSIGYRALPMEEVPFDKETGIIPNAAGRVSQGVYCSGWVKTGPVGVILNTMDNAFETAETIIEDFKADKLPSFPDEDDILSLLKTLPGVSPTSFSDWKLIDREEVKGGQNKPREKIVTVQEMMAIIKLGQGN